MKRVLLSFTALILCVAFAATTVDAAEKIALSKYPNVKVGFTTWNFSKQMPVNLANAKKWVDFAVDNGFPWLELRDPTASLTLAECKEIATYAKQRNIEVIYAVAVGVLDANFWEVFSRAVANADQFDGPRIVRTALSGQEFAPNPKKTTWTLAEMARIVRVADRAANAAKMRGLQHVVENSTPSLKGDGATSFGTTEFFANAGSNVGWQIDVANFFVTQRVPAKPDEARAFLEKHAPKLFYAHIKTATADNKTAIVLGANPLPFDAVFQAISKNKTPYVAMELPQPNSLEELYANTKKSVDYLRQNY